MDRSICAPPLILSLSPEPRGQQGPLAETALLFEPLHDLQTRLSIRHTPCAVTSGRHTECACYFALLHQLESTLSGGFDVRRVDRRWIHDFNHQFGQDAPAAVDVNPDVNDPERQ